MKIIEAMHFGKPTMTNGALYLMLTPYHWLVTDRTFNKELVRRYSIVQVESRDKNQTRNIPVFVTNTINGKRADELKQRLSDIKHPLKPVINGEPWLNFWHNHLHMTNANLHHLESLLAALHDQYSTNLNIKMEAKRDEPLSRIILLKESGSNLNDIVTQYKPCDKKYAWWS